MSHYKFNTMKASVSEKYDFRFSPNGYAILYIDELAGLISMQTDWGNFSFGWSRAGRGPVSLKRFLVCCDSSYLINKFCKRTYFDIEQSKAELRKIMETECLSDQEKRDCHDELEDFHADNIDQMYFSIADSCPTLFKLVMKEDLYGLPASMDYVPCERSFFEEIWPMIRAELKKVVEAEEAQKEETK